MEEIFSVKIIKILENWYECQRNLNLIVKSQSQGLIDLEHGNPVMLYHLVMLVYDAELCVY